MILPIEASNADMDKSLESFKKRLDENDVGRFFFAGHGMQLDERNYPIAIDTDTSGETEGKHSSPSLERIIDTMDKSAAATKIIILDACRNNTSERAFAVRPEGLSTAVNPKMYQSLVSTNEGLGWMLSVAPDDPARSRQKKRLAPFAQLYNVGTASHAMELLQSGRGDLLNLIPSTGRAPARPSLPYRSARKKGSCCPLNGGPAYLCTS